MTHIKAIKIHQLRNLTEVEFSPGPHFNVFYGDNGSGKTSILEAIHYLGLGRSFRTRHNARVVNHDHDQFTVFAQVQHSNMTLPIGLTRAKSGDSQLRLSGSPTQLNIIADLLPIQLIHPDGHKLLTAGPKYRRQYLDWGVFHVEHSFYHSWQRAQRALAQRNKMLKSGVSSYQELSIWDQELNEAATNIDKARAQYLKKLLPRVLETFANMALNLDLSIDYQSGWDTNLSLKNVLQQSFSRDRKLGYTNYGPHKADIVIKTAKKPAHEVLSQGQQKMLVYALKLGQSRLLLDECNKQSIFLIDDLPAELDPTRRANLTSLLSPYASQIFITGIELNTLEPFIQTTDAKLFHVEHGGLTHKECSTWNIPA